MSLATPYAWTGRIVRRPVTIGLDLAARRVGASPAWWGLIDCSAFVARADARMRSGRYALEDLAIVTAAVRVLRMFRPGAVR